MRSTPRLRFALPICAAALWPAAAAAQQGPTVDPTPDTGAAAPTAPPATPAPAPGGAQPGAAPAGGEEGGSYNIHYDEYLEGDALDLDDRGTSRQGNAGLVPPVHVVRGGDTLWDISGVYFSDSWQWPRVWSYNPEITNPHWIYPGDRVRLRSETGAPGDTASEPLVAEPGGEPAPVAATRPHRGFAVRQLAFVDAGDLEGAARVDGSPDEKMMLSEGDDVYVAAGDEALEVGKRYAIYLPKQEVTHPVSGDVIGSYVEVIGQLEVRSNKADLRARGRLIDSVDVVERGMRVGPVRTQYKDVEARTASSPITGLIAAQIENDVLIGARQAVILDRGAKDGVEVGNSFYVVRRGDAYAEVMQPGNNVGQNDEEYPARVLGEVLVVDVGEHTSLAMVTVSLQELGVGDRVIARTARQ